MSTFIFSLIFFLCSTFQNDTSTLNGDCACSITITDFSSPSSPFGAFYQVSNGKTNLLSSNASTNSTIFGIPRSGNSTLDFRVRSLDASNPCPESTISYTISCFQDHNGEPQLFHKTTTVNPGNNCSTVQDTYSANSECLITNFQ